MARFAPRLHVLLAHDAPTAVVVRRGPSKSVATVLWDRRRDHFQVGQWLKGRIYERRSDLSPDGKHLIYFAMNGKWRSEARGAWTAISRAPYLKAIALFAKGDCWHGGGLWTGTRTYWLNGGYGHTILRDSSAVRLDQRYQPATNWGGECLGVYYPRLLRDGWALQQRVQVAQWKSKDIFEKPVGKGWVLRKIAHADVGAPAGKGCYWDEHELAKSNSDLVVPCPTWEWAELDGTRLVWATDGILKAARMETSGLVEETELFDFNGMTFAPIEAPY